IGYLFATILLPMFSMMLSEKKDISELLALSTKLIMFVAFIAAINSFFFREDIMGLLYREANTAQAQDIFGILMLSFPAVASVYIFGTLLTANGNIKQLNYIALSGMAINILLNWWFISTYKATGAAYTTIFTQYLVALLHFIFTIRFLKINIRLQQLLKLLAFLSSVVILNIAGTYLDLEWWILFLSITLIEILLAFMLKLISVKEITNYLKGE
ncbi:MAG: polysaccharide biosynthesis C-terminal domain-containing protein, partial [Bacteroidetes bacterium]|nr:polysaccharide biosynthesis C-terminal domain-containing protein [Bacteroidota bacterium]